MCKMSSHYAFDSSSSFNQVVHLDPPAINEWRFLLLLLLDGRKPNANGDFPMNFLLPTFVLRHWNDVV